MKKVTTIFLLVLFLIANSGVAVSMHWCGKKLASITFFSENTHKCPCGKRAMKPGCCKDKIVHIKAKSDLVKTNLISFNVSTKNFLFISQNQFLLIEPLMPDQIELTNFYHPPPFKPKAPTYLLHGVFLI